MGQVNRDHNHDDVTVEVFAPSLEALLLSRRNIIILIKNTQN